MTDSVATFLYFQPIAIEETDPLLGAIIDRTPVALIYRHFVNTTDGSKWTIRKNRMVRASFKVVTRLYLLVDCYLSRFGGDRVNIRVTFSEIMI